MKEHAQEAAVDVSRPLALLADWAKFSEQWWYDIPGRPDLGCYGTGYNSWGVQTNQKYLSAMAVLGTHPETPRGVDRQWALERALKALRFSFASHLTGPAACTDGTSWGHTWISGLGIERMMYAVYLLEPHLSDADRMSLRRMLVSEADWIWQDHCRGRHRGVFGGRWAASGKNVPESNLWNGALLWRTAGMYPDNPNAESWRTWAHRFLINSVSVAADARDENIVAGRPVKEWFEGANFFDNFALDHHGYLNVGYMVICASNAAMLHFDMKAKGLARPGSLDHHQDGLWDTIRRMLFTNGRLARIGGDSRVRYCYCQEYLLPSLMYAADRLGETHAAGLTDGVLDMIECECAWSGDGGFYSRRLKQLQVDSPYYYTRLESDRACALGQLITFSALLDTALTAAPEPFEKSVAGGWHEPGHGAVMHRCPTRLASVSWRAHSQTQAMCQPPDQAHLADWAQNLTGAVRFAGYDPQGTCDQRRHRCLLHSHVQPFDGGFVTCGRIGEGCAIRLNEGYAADDAVADHWIALAALPDGHTLLGLQYVRVRGIRTLLQQAKGLHLNLINDFYNGSRRRLVTGAGEMILEAPPRRDELIPLAGRWLNVEDRLGIAGLYGAETLCLHRSEKPGAGSQPMLCSLNVEEINWHCEIGIRAVDPGEVLMDAGWAVLSGVTAAETSGWAAENPGEPNATENLRSVTVSGMDGNRYLFAANFTHDEVCLGEAESSGIISGCGSGCDVTVSPGHARLWRLADR